MKRSIAFVCLIIICSLFFAGCLDSKNNNPGTPLSLVLFANLSPDTTATLNASIQGNILTTVPYGTFTNYGTVNPGAVAVKVSSTKSTDIIIDTAFTAEEAKYYSIFAIDSLNKLKTVWIADPLVSPGNDSSMVRFLDFSPNAPALDLTLASGEVLFSNRTFNDQNTNSSYASFQRVPAGTFDLEVHAAGTSTVLATIPKFQLLGGKIYTLVIKGLTGQTGVLKFTTGNIRHN